MRLTIDQSAFLDALQWATRAVDARPTMPILSGIMLHADELLHIGGFDYELSAESVVAADVAERGRVLVGGHLLSSLVRSLPAAPVVLETQESDLFIASGQTSFTLPLMPVEDYPTIPEVPPTLGTVPADDLLRAVNQTSVAADRGDTIPILGGVYLEAAGEILTFVSTDRYRVAVRILEWTPSAGDFTALVRACQLQQFSRAFGGVARAELLGTSDGATLSSLGIAVPSRSGVLSCLDGTYVPWRRLLKHSFDSRIEVEVAPLLEAMKRVSLVASRRITELTFTDGEVTVSASSDTNARATETLPSQHEGEELTVGVNPAYLIDGLAGVHTNTVVIACNGATKPMHLSSTDTIGDAASFRYVLMPIIPRD
ncbi:MAG: DNA polymerase III subunit beta [Micrococcales bacterium]|nr:MAG: DNA polymerase III subunit beta [Micrococcales bacterium]